MKNSKAFGISEKVYVSGFEIKKLGSLKQGELEWFETESNKRLESLLPIYELATRVSKESEAVLGKSIDGETALGLVQAVGDQDLYQLFLLNYSKDLLVVKEKSYSENLFQRNICTMFLRSRVSKKFLAEKCEEINDYFDIEIDPTKPEWKDEYTGSLLLATINKIIDFVTGEKTEWIDEPKAIEEDVDLGK